MKRVLFVVAALCTVSSTAGADDFVSDFRQYITKGHQRLRAGDLRGALSQFCSYMYVDAAGAHADEASANARAISAKLGNPTQSDHDACESRAPASQQSSAVTGDVFGVQQKPPRIYKREIVGLGLVAASVVSLGLALREGAKVVDLRTEIDAKPSGIDLDILHDREDSAQLKQKLYLAAGGAALLTGGILYVLGRRDRLAAETTIVAPSVTKGGATVNVGRRF